jgi:hypothetical protein
MKDKMIGSISDMETTNMKSNHKPIDVDGNGEKRKTENVLLIDAAHADGAFGGRE